MRRFYSIGAPDPYLPNPGSGRYESLTVRSFPYLSTMNFEKRLWTRAQVLSMVYLPEAWKSDLIGFRIVRRKR